jgi:hypothetical protein
MQAVAGIAVSVVSATVSAGGTGYAVSDTITLANGVVLTVQTLNVTAVATVSVTNGGSVATAPANPQAQVSTSGTGTGATFDLTWGGGDFSAVSSAANTVAATLNDIKDNITSADVPADNTMVLYLTDLLIAQTATLQQAISASDTQAITDSSNDVNLATTNFNQCVTRMGEVIVVPDPVDARPWMGEADQPPPSQEQAAALVAKTGKPLP